MSLSRTCQFLSPLAVCLFCCHFTALWPCRLWGQLVPASSDGGRPSMSPGGLSSSCSDVPSWLPPCPWRLSGGDTECWQARPHRFWGYSCRELRLVLQKLLSSSPVMLFGHLSVVKSQSYSCIKWQNGS